MGNSPIPGARDALDWVNEKGIPHRFVTNTTSRPRAAVGDKLRGMGIDLEDELILTPPVAACEWLRRQGAGASRYSRHRPPGASSPASRPCRRPLRTVPMR